MSEIESESKTRKQVYQELLAEGRQQSKLHPTEYAKRKFREKFRRYPKPREMS